MVLKSTGAQIRTSTAPNLAEHDKIVLECMGYRRSRQVECVSTRFTAGLYHMTVWVLTWTIPSVAQRLLAPCALTDAEYVVAKLIDGRQRLVQVDVLTSYAGWPRRSEVRQSQPLELDHCLRIFRLFLRLYYYSDEHGTFVAAPAMPWTIPDKICDALEALRSIDQGGTWKTFNAGQQRYRDNVLQLFGAQAQPVRVLELIARSFHRAVPPAFLIQYLELLFMAIAVDYYIYSIIIGLLSIAGNAIYLAHMYQQFSTMVHLVQRPRIVPLVQSGWVRAASSNKLVPGDVVVVTKGRVTCDMVLLRGSCIAQESMLSGEGKQVRKASYVPDRDVDYNPDSCHTCTVYAGTVLLQVWNAEDPDDEALAMVVRTNFNTTMGSMARQLLAPIRCERDDPFMRDCFRLYAYALFIQLILYTVYLIHYWQVPYHTPLRDVIQRTFEIIVHAAPPGVPTVLLFSSASHIGRFRQQGIIVHEPDRLKSAGETQICLFDKTGTLTGSSAKMHGVFAVHKATFGPLQTSATTWSNKLTQAAAACNGLTMINRSTVAGDELESALFKTVEARFLDRKTVVLPRKPNALSDARMATVKMLHVLEFNSQTLKSGVVVLSDDAPPGGGLLFVRGAPGAIKGLVRPASVPQDFDQVREDYSSRSFRLMAMAVGVLHDVHQLDLPRMSLAEIEAHATQLELLGLIVLSNQIRPDSRDTITQLQQGGGIRVAMVTGDNQHTAIAVAKGVGMADPSKPILLIDAGRAEPRQPLPDCIQTHFSPHHAPQEGALQSALYAHTGDSQAVAAIYAGQHFQSARESKGSRDQCAQHMFHSRDQHAQHGRGQHAQHAFADSGAQMSLEEFAAIQHALSIQVDPALYCINRHVSFGPDSVRTLTAYAHQYSADSPEETLIEPTLVQPSLAHTPIHPRIQPASVMKNSLRPRKNNFFAPRHPPEPPSTFRKDALFAHHHPPEPPPTSRRLKITDASNGQEVDRLSALSALAEGRMQCAVSGDSFEQLLQQSDVSVLELVMRSAVVFARMKPHQKGQMMDLLGKRGIHQMFQGQPRHIQGLQCTTLFCGDGINDLSALAAADVSMAIGATDAFVAASVTTPKMSIAGVLTLVRAGKSHGVLVAALFKFMIVYQIVQSTAETIAYALDGSKFSNLQRGAMDIQAMSLALAAATTPPLTHMTPRCPPRYISNPAALVLLTVMYMGCQLAQASHIMLLTTRSWFQGGNGSSNNNPVSSLMLEVGMQQVLGPLISLTIECGRFCRIPLATKPMLLVLLAYLAFIQLVFLLGPEHFGSFLSPLKLFDFPRQFRYENELVLVCTAAAYTIAVNVTRRLLDAKQQHRIQPVLQLA